MFLSRAGFSEAQSKFSAISMFQKESRNDMYGQFKSERLKHQQGVAAVEFAIVLPLLVFLFVGITEFGIAYYNKQVLTNASREGARAGIVAGTAEKDIREIAFNYADGRLITFGANNFSEHSINPESIGEYLKVNVTFEYTYFLLAGFKFFGADFGPKLNINASTLMKMEPEV